MNGTIKKAVIVILGIAALACMGVSMAAGQTPVLTGSVACIGIVGICTIWLISQRGRQKAMPRPETTTPFIAEYPVEEQKVKLAQQYNTLQDSLSIPDSAQTVQMPTNLLPADNVNLMYYCWKTDTHLLLFPCWDSLEATLGMLQHLESSQVSRPIPLHPIRIPLSSIACFSKEPYDHDIQSFTLLHYRNSLGDNVGLMMQEDAYSVLKSLIPHLDLGIIQSQRYPQSSRQILDITTKLQQLKALHMQALIDEDEYTIKKKQLLTTL